MNGGGPGGEYVITGHKWFCSAPMCDAFLVLAQAPRGLSCFLLPRWLPDGTRNAFHIQRLKDKLGNRSNASSEVEFRGAWARLVGEEGRGVATIIEMVMLTRLDCMLGSAAEMRMALAQASHHAHHRRAFGKPLVAHALMRNVLADLAVESEAATTAAITTNRLRLFFNTEREPAVGRTLLLWMLRHVRRITVSTDNGGTLTLGPEAVRPVGFAEPPPLRFRSVPTLFSAAGRELSFDGERKVRLHCRPNALRRAVNNLIDNALKYGHRADVQLDADAQRVRIGVLDRGPGIPPEELDKVLLPFYRIESSRQRREIYLEYQSPSPIKVPEPLTSSVRAMYWEPST